MPKGLLYLAQCLDSTNPETAVLLFKLLQQAGVMKIEDSTTLPVEHQVQKEYTGKEMAFCHSPPLFRLSTENVPLSL